MRFAALLLMGAAAAGAGAAPVDYRIEPAATRIHFELPHFGTSTIRGRFDALDGRILIDREARRGEVSITVQTGSVSSGLRPFDAVIRGVDVLAAEAHPQAWFVASRIEFDERGEPRRVAGELTLRGVGRPFTLNALRFRCAPRPPEPREVCGGDFEGFLQRSDFGITHALPFVGDRVRIVVQVEAAPR